MSNSDTLRTFPAAPEVPDDDLHTRACMEYAAKTKKAYCIAECADARRHRNWLRATHATPSPAHRDTERELLRAAQRIALLEKAHREIADAQCDARGATLLGSCKCCLHDRAIAKAALAGVE